MDLDPQCDFGHLLHIPLKWLNRAGAGMVKGEKVCRVSGTSCGPRDVPSPTTQLLCLPTSHFLSHGTPTVFQTRMTRCIFITVEHSNYSE